MGTPWTQLKRADADGWTGWVPVASLLIQGDGKERPWCRGRGRGGQVEWFPRTSKPPREGLRFALKSPAGHLPGLRRPGWFVVNAYVRKPAAFRPRGEELGVLPDAELAELYAKLETFYWEAR